MSEVSDTLDRSAPDGGHDPGHDPGSLLPSTYNELRRLAAQKLANERSGQTLQATALVHEAYLRLMSGPGEEARWKNHGHFFAAAAETMRRILVENARRKNRIKHGGGRDRVELGDHATAVKPLSDDIVALDKALMGLAKEDPAAAQVVEL